MASGVSGRGDLLALQKRVKALGGQRAQRDMSRVLAEESIRQVNESFRMQTDPFDRAWKPSMRAALTGDMTLSDRGILRRSITYRDVTAKGFRIGSPVKYANIHQWGGIIRAKTSFGLRFRVPTGLAGKRRKRGKQKLTEQWLNKQSVTMPRRSFLPDAQEGFPPRWRKAWEQAYRGYVRRVLELK